jgi:hypothetical protein
MHNFLLAVILALGIVATHGQGTFQYLNPGAGRTRLGSLDGAFAGTNILGQMLIGRAPDSLVPFGMPLIHNSGVINGGVATVPGIDGNEVAYMQLVAWDSLLWGTSLANVPLDQLGRTDIIPLMLSYPFQIPLFPQFNQPAIVPVPEPSVFALLALGGAVAWAIRRKPG